MRQWLALCALCLLTMVVGAAAHVGRGVDAPATIDAADARIEAGEAVEDSMSIKVKRMTPILVVDSIRNDLPFWRDRLGFTVETEVPEGEGLGFVILKHGAVELMLQSLASVASDIPALAEAPRGTSLYVEVEDLDSVIEAVRGCDAIFEERKTFYGSREIGVRDPSGNTVVFAQFPEGGPE